MARKRGIPALRLHKPSGRATVRIDGRDHYLGKYGTPESQEAYNRTIAEWLISRANTSLGPSPASLTVTAMILVYWRHALAYYKGKDGGPGHEVKNLRHALRPVRDLYGSTVAAEFGPRGLKAVRAAMVKSGCRRTGC